MTSTWKTNLMVVTAYLVIDKNGDRPYISFNYPTHLVRNDKVKLFEVPIELPSFGVDEVLSKFRAAEIPPPGKF